MNNPGDVHDEEYNEAHRLTVNPNKFRILKTFVETDYLKVFE